MIESAQPNYQDLINTHKFKIGVMSLSLGLTALNWLAFIPQFPIPIQIANLALRTSGLGYAGLNVIEAWQKGDRLALVFRCTNVVLVALGMGAVVIASQPLAIAALTAHLVLKIFEMMYFNDEEKLLSFGAFLVDLIALPALANGSLELIVTAGIVNTLVAIFSIYISYKKVEEYQDMIAGKPSEPPADRSETNSKGSSSNDRSSWHFSYYSPIYYRPYYHSSWGSGSLRSWGSGGSTSFAPIGGAVLGV